MNLCPISNCGRPVMHGQHLCLHHWHMVPYVDQLTLKRRYRAWSSCIDPRKRESRQKAFQRVRDRVLGAVQGIVDRGKPCADSVSV